MLTRFLTTAAAFALSAGAASAEYNLTILHINDFHARFEPINSFDSTCSEKEAAENKCFGGIARLTTAIRDVIADAIAESDRVRSAVLWGRPRWPRADHGADE